jgi:putative FmdB family regulatory protein
MPIYEYQCGKCGKVSEHLVIGNDGEKICCTECGSDDVSKVMSAHNTSVSSPKGMEPGGGCCGSPNSCGMSGSCCMQ